MADEPPAPNANPGVPGVAVLPAPNTGFGVAAAGVEAVAGVVPNSDLTTVGAGVTAAPVAVGAPNRFPFMGVPAGVTAGVACAAAGVAATTGVAATAATGVAVTGVAAGFAAKLNEAPVAAAVVVVVGNFAPVVSAGLAPNAKPPPAVVAAGLAAATVAVVATGGDAVAGLAASPVAVTGAIGFADKLNGAAAVVGAPVAGFDERLNGVACIALVGGAAAATGAVVGNDDVFGAPTEPKLNVEAGVPDDGTAVAGLAVASVVEDGGLIEPKENPPGVADGSATAGVAVLPVAAAVGAGVAPTPSGLAATVAAAVVAGTVAAGVAAAATAPRLASPLAAGLLSAATGLAADGTTDTVAFGNDEAGLIAATAAAVSSSSTANVSRLGTAASALTGSSAMAFTSADSSAKFDTPGDRLRPTTGSAGGNFALAGGAAALDAGFDDEALAGTVVAAVGLLATDERTSSSSTSSCALVSLTRNAF